MNSERSRDESEAGPARLDNPRAKRATPGWVSGLPILLLFVAIVSSRLAGLNEVYEHPALRLLLSSTFYTLVSIGTLVLVGRSFLASGSVGLLWLECGVLLWSLAGTLGDLLYRGDANLDVTIFNVGILLAALCQLAGAVLTTSPRRLLNARPQWLVLGITLSLAALGLVASAALAGWLPVFFIQGLGGTPVRYAVLFAAIAMFLSSAVVLRAGGRERLKFVEWYSLALLSMAVGLFGITIQTSFGGVVNWLSRTAQWLGGVYLLVAAVISVREDGAWKLPLGAAQLNRQMSVWDSWLQGALTPRLLWSLPAAWRYGLTVAIVAAATALRWELVPWMGTTALYNIALGTTVCTTLLFGIGPGLLSVPLGNFSLEYLLVRSLSATFSGQAVLRLSVSLAVGALTVYLVHAIRTAQLASRRNEARFSAFAAATFEGIVESEAGRVVDCNDQFAQMAGYDLSELRGMALIDLIAPEERERAAVSIRENRDAVGEYTALRKDGSRFAVETRGRPSAPNGRHRFTAVRDVTARKLAAEALARERENLQRMFDVVNVGLLLVDANGAVARVNDTVSKWVGKDLFASLGGQPGDVVGCAHALSDPAGCGHTVHCGSCPIRRAFESALRTGESVHGVETETHLVVDGRPVDVWLDVSADPLVLDGRKHVLLALNNITARMRAEEALRESEEKYRRLFLNITEEVHFWKLVRDDEGHIKTWMLVDANPPALKTWGRNSVEEIRGKTTDEIFGPGATQHYMPIVQKVVNEGVPHVYEDYFPNLDRHFRFTTVPLGEYYITTGADITGLKKAEESLLQLNVDLERRVAERTAEVVTAGKKIQAERQRFLDVLDTLPVIVDIVRPDHRIEWANRAYREGVGEGQGCLCFASWLGRNEPCEGCQAFTPLKTGRPHNWEWTLPNGRTFDVYNFPFADTDGSPMILAMEMEITERRQAEVALRRASAYNRSLIEASLDPMVTIGPDGTITDVNAATETVTGLSREALIGTDFSNYFTEPEKARAGYQQVFREGVVRDYPLEIRGCDGHPMSVLYNATVYRDQDGQVAGVFAAARDVTDRLRSERALADRAALIERQADELRALATELAQAEQRERQRLAKILHDNIQQLLVAAQIQLDLIKRADPKTIKSTMHGMDAILAETMEASRSLTVELCPPVLHQSGLAAALAWLAARLNDKQQFTVHLRATDDAEPASPDERAFLFEATREILLNAAKHSGRSEARVTMMRDGDDCCRVIVEDEGRGFDPASVKPGPSGGFGLFSIQQRLLCMGGTLEIESAPGQGTRAVLAIPIRRHAGSEAAPASASSGGAGAQVSFRARAHKIAVLLVDDHKLMRQGLSSLLQFESDIDIVAEAENGEQALEAFRRFQPDVVIMDVNMPVMNGIEATRRLLEAAPGARVIALSMHDDTDAAGAMREVGAVAYLTKGGPSEDLVAAIRACASGRGGKDATAPLLSAHPQHPRRQQHHRAK